MTDYAREILSDGKLLRQKLEIFLQTPSKVEIYARACEKFFAAGKQRELTYVSTWSWWAFFRHAVLFSVPQGVQNCRSPICRCGDYLLRSVFG
ncbi:hypothetical protein [uncultured Campylobacter sp.]|mgnify:CR=1 FL=1|uniref:hypothetical protein n=1 Tax=uncultured Campylobacter sp. TaxID=218934 RepID=UPI002602B938|nr:hypothetical protein [uncultured Campylobacter sp.]